MLRFADDIEIIDENNDSEKIIKKVHETFM